MRLFNNTGGKVVLCFTSNPKVKSPDDEALFAELDFDSEYISLDVFHFIDQKVRTDEVFSYELLPAQFVYPYRDHSQFSIDSFEADFTKVLHMKQYWQCGIRTRYSGHSLSLDVRTGDLNEERGCFDHRHAIIFDINKAEGASSRAGYIQMSFLYTDNQVQRWCKVINIVVEMGQQPAKMLNSIDPYLFLFGRMV